MRITVVFVASMVCLFFGSNVQAQGEIKWNYSFDYERSEILMIAQLKDHWHLYSQFIDEHAGPVPTQFAFQTHDDYQIIDGVEEPDPIVFYDKNFDSKLKIFKDEVVFRQRISTSNAIKVEGEILYMLCDNHGCLPPTLEKFTIHIPHITN